MKLTSDDILRQDFNTKAFGFSKEEVMSFLEIVSAEYEELLSENALLKKQLTEKSNQVQLLDESRSEIKDILNTLRNFTRESLDIAHKNNLMEQQLVKKDEEIIKTINNGVGEELKKLFSSIQGFKELTEAKAKEEKVMSKSDLERFVSTVQAVKEEELKKVEAEAASIIREAKRSEEDLIREAMAEADRIKEQAIPIINEAKQKAEEINKEANEMARRMTEEATQLVNQAHQNADKKLRDAERTREEASLALNEAQQKAEEMIREANKEAERIQEEASQVVKKAQQRAEAVVQDAENEASRIRLAFAEIKKQHQFFKDRMKEIIELQLQILGSAGGEEGKKEPNPWAAPK